MSRKHPSFAQLIDYIEGETKLKSRQYSIHHNLYSRDQDHIKAAFIHNAKHLKQRKNGVYLYHEVVSIEKSYTLTEDEQKARLQTIVREYLNARGRNNLAYAVLHEDTDNLHFHIVMSANEAGEHNRKRLSKAEFAGIQTNLEQWVLTHQRELEQKAVFHKNQTKAERAEREAQRAKRDHLGDKGEQMKRRGAKTDKRDQVQERLTDIFETATNPRHFTELMGKAGFTLYTRGKTHGITDREGNKYRLARLGLADAWQKLDEKMNARLQEERADRTKTQSTTTDTGEEEKPPSTLEVVGYEFFTGKLHKAWHGDQTQHTEKKETNKETKTDSTSQTTQQDQTTQHDNTKEHDHTHTKEHNKEHKHTQTKQDPIQTEAEKRLAEMKEIRAKRNHHEQRTRTQNTNRE